MHLQRILALIVLLVLVSCSKQNASPSTAAAANESLRGDSAETQSLSIVQEPEIKLQLSGEIADQPLQGVLNGQPITIDSAFVDNGTVTLTTAEENGDSPITIWLFRLMDQDKPNDYSIGDEELHWSILRPTIHINGNKRVDIAGRSLILTEPKVDVVIGEEQDYRIPLSLKVEAVTDSSQISIEGNILVKTAELVATDGVIDITHDSLETVEYVAREYLVNRFPDKAVNITKEEGLHLRYGESPGDALAYVTIIYSLAGSETAIQKSLLRKNVNMEWFVANELEEKEMFLAHYDNRSDSGNYEKVKKLAALYFEKEYYASESWRKIREPSSTGCTYSPNDSINYCNINFGRYKDDSFESLECTVVSFGVGFDGHEWRVLSATAEGKYYDRKQKAFVEKEEVLGC